MSAHPNLSDEAKEHELQKIVDALVVTDARMAQLEAEKAKHLARAAHLADEIGTARRALAKAKLKAERTAERTAELKAKLEAELTSNLNTELQTEPEVQAKIQAELQSAGPLLFHPSDLPDYQEMLRRDVYARIGAALRVTDRTISRWCEQAEMLTRDYANTHEQLELGKLSKAHTVAICDAGIIIDDDAQRQRYEETILKIAETESVNRVREIAKRLAESFTDRTLDERAKEARLSRCVKLQPIDDDLALVTASLPLTEATGMVDRLTRMAWEIWRHNRQARLRIAEMQKYMAEGPYTADEFAQLELAASDLRTVTQLKADLLLDLVLTGGPSAPHSTAATVHTDDNAGASHTSDTTDPSATAVTAGTDGTAGISDSSDASVNDVLLSRGADTGKPTPATDDWCNINSLSGITAHVQVVIPLLSLLPEEHVAQLRQFPGFELIEQYPGMHGAPHIVGTGPINIQTARFLAGAAPGWDRILTHPVTGVVEQVDRYQPTQSLKRFLRARDEHCRFPGCRMPARRCEIDHTIDWAKGGTTTASNLAHLCSRHHQLKHHTDWQVKQFQDGVLKWTSPTGSQHSDRPASTVRFRPSAPPARAPQTEAPQSEAPPF